MAKDPYRYFRIEARELIEQIGKGVLALEQGVRDAEQVALLLRWAHTLKGAARVVRQAEIADLIHGVEEWLAPPSASTASCARPATPPNACGWCRWRASSPRWNAARATPPTAAAGKSC